MTAFAVTTDGFARIGDRIARSRLPLVLVQEGGCPSPARGPNLGCFLDGVLGA